MSYRSLLMFNTALDSAQKAAANIQSIQEARIKHEREAEAFDLKKKEAALTLDKMALGNEDTRMNLQAKKSYYDQIFGTQKKVLEGQQAQIDQAEHQATQQYQQSHAVAAKLFENNPDIQSIAMAHAQNPVAQAPGPDGGMVQGEDVTQDNTPEAVGSLFGNLPKPGQSVPTMTTKGMGSRQVTPKEVTDAQFGAIKAAKENGIPLMPDEQKIYDKAVGVKPYNRGQVVNTAMRLAASDAMGGKPTAAQVKAAIPKAEEMLYGKASEVDSPAQGKLKTMINPLDIKKDRFGFAPGSVQSFPGRQGQYKYLGQGKFKRVS